jgi:hypothetical protein
MIKRGLQALALVWMHAALALGTGSPACPAAPGAGRYPAWRADAAQALARRGDAGSLATAAALCSIASGSRLRAAPMAGNAAVDLAARASELDPQSPSIGWLRLQLCASSAGCDIREAATTLRWVDADNGAVWLPTLAAVKKDNDPEEIDRILSDMAEGSRFDFYLNPTVVLLFDTLSHARSELPPHYLGSDDARLSEAMLVAGNEIIPPLSAVTNACRDPASAQRRESCIKLARVMQKADTVAAQVAGLHIEKHLAPADGKEARMLAERRRVLEWRETSASLDEGLPWRRDAMARERIAEMRAAPREEDVDTAFLRKHRLPLDPPEERP